MTRSNIFVTGGTGFLGAYLLHNLLKRDYRPIRALKRANSPMNLVEDIAHRIEWVEGDILDIPSLEDAMQGMQQVYHCAAVVSYDPRDREKLMSVNVKGTANVVNIALVSAVEKLVHVSSVAALGRSKRTSHLSETARWENSKRNSQYAISKHLAELEVWRGVAEGLNAAIVNPSIILGSGFWHQGTCKFFMNGWNNFNFYARGGTGWVDARDVVRAMIDLMESNISGERFILNGENITYQDIMNEISDALKKKRPSIKVNYLLQELAWRGAWLQSRMTNKQSFITKETARHSSKCYYYENDKSIEQLNVAYTPIRQTISETAAQLKEAANNNFNPMLLPLH